VALKTSDLATGYKQVVARYRTNAELAKSANVKLSLLQSKGRLTGYETIFQKSGKRAGDYILVDDTVSDYTAQSGAVWAYNTNVKKATPTSGFKPLQLATIGVKSRAFTQLLKVGAGQRVDLVVFYDRTFSAAVQIQGPNGKVSKADLLRYARIMDSRIKSQ
jgi:hypothetical protein